MTSIEADVVNKKGVGAYKLVYFKIIMDLRVQLLTLRG